MFVGLDRVRALILQLIGAQLIEQPDAAALLVFVDQQAAAFGGDGIEGQLELPAAIAAQAVEHVAGETLGMDAHQGRAAGEIAHLQYYGFFNYGSRPHNGAWLGGRPCAGGIAAARSFESENSEMPETGGEIGLGRLANVIGWGITGDKGLGHE